MAYDTVGNHVHQELWVPADELKAFNQHIIGVIEVIKEYRKGLSL